jgi:hypothetical protein
MKRISLLVATGALFAAPVSVFAASSAYTDFDLKKCRHVSGEDVEDYGEWFCRGYRGISIYMNAGDQRIYVSYGNNAKNEPAASQTLASFNGEGSKIEWRIENGKPFATIMRWRTTVTNEKRDSVRGSVLVVTKLSGGVCHVGYVDGANKDANALARQIADKHARVFSCGKDKPIVLGEQGPGFSGPYDSVK